ncbi:hypothetical protein GCM10022289_09200 [Pedobacter jeongneungensis]|uniref:FecR family protein n=1 Tax=Pedobacter jeongneungensis TaxID=947309 RepID=A0ABP8B6C4_9SPHI
MSESNKKDKLTNEERFDQLWNETDNYIENPNAGLVYQKLKDELFPSAQPKILRLNKMGKWLGYVAIFAVVAGAFWFYQHQSHNSLVQIVTARGENRIINLPDGSKIALQENSGISYKKSANREIELKGNAQFTVVHNSSKPFIVTAGELLVKDVGTVFKVTMQDDQASLKSIRVSVSEGSVSILNKKTLKTELTLAHGEEAVYDKRNGMISKKNTGPEVKSITFDNATITAVLEKVSATYGVKLDVANQNITQKTFTGKFEGENIDEVLDMIGFTLNFRHIKKDGKILILFNGDGK